MIIGLTGGIASGKTTVSNYFKSMDIPIVDADLIARQVVEPESKGLELIVEAFGNEMVVEGALNRKALRQLVFSDEKALKTLNEITHPLIRNGILKDIEHYKRLKAPLIVLDAPLLLENHLEVLVDEVWLVALSQDIQLERLMARDAVSREDGLNIISKQMSLKNKIKKSHVVLNNNHTIDDLLKQVKETLESRMSIC